MRAMSMLLTAMGLLLGCATAPPNESSPWYRIPVGSELVLETQVQVPARQDRVYFQDGAAMDWRQVNIYRPHCALSVADKTETTQSISPDRFSVKSSHSERFFKQVRRQEQPPQVRPAAFESQVTTVAGWDRDGRMDYEVTALVIDLESARQPHVKTLTCADWGLPQDTIHITVEKVRQALGGMARLELLPTE